MYLAMVDRYSSMPMSASISPLLCSMIAVLQHTAVVGHAFPDAECASGACDEIEARVVSSSLKFKADSSSGARHFLNILTLQPMTAIPFLVRVSMRATDFAGSFRGI